MTPILYLIDGHAVAYRQFFGLPLSSFTSKTGEPTNAVFGFTRILMDILEKDKPDYLAVSFDMGLSGRDTVYGEYKGTREKMPDELAIQLDRIQQLVKAFNIPVLALDGYEADDVIGTVTKQAEEQGVQVRIITGDRDLLQLLTENVTVQLPSRGGPDTVFDIPAFVEKYQIQPEQLVDVKALQGDSSDNIPGVKGIGEKGATKLLLEYGTLDNIYANIDAIKGATHKKLVAEKDSAYMSYELAMIKRNVPVTLNLQDCVAHEFDVNEVLEIFDIVNFRTLRDRLIEITTPTTGSMFDDSDFFDEDFSPPPLANQLFETHVVTTESQLNELAKKLQSAQWIVWDTETTSTNQMEAELVGIALAVDAEHGYYIPVGHDSGKQLELRIVIDALRPALTNENIPKAAHNASYDLVMMQRYGIDVTPIGFDTMIAEWLTDPASKNLGLKNLVQARLRDEDGKAIWMTPISDLIGKGAKQITMAEVSVGDAAPYATADAVMTFRLVEVLLEELKSHDLLGLYEKLELPLIPVIAEVESNGVVLDTSHLSQLSQSFGESLDDLENEIVDLTGGYGSFNINSPKQLNDVLFGKLGLPTTGLKKTTHGFSTDAVTLDKLKDEHPIINKIIEYRELSKLKSTYIDALPELINPKTGRIHTSYNQTGTTTGRLSSSDPNLQNIPIRTEIGREVRRAFVAPDGYSLLAVDYSQVELRILAHISQDQTLIEAFSQGLDIHKATAAAVFDMALDDVSYEQRSFAKRVNFGLIYGMGAFRLARDSDLSFEEAKQFVDTYFQRLPKVQDYIENTKREARENGKLSTLFGRIRTFPALSGGRGSKQAMQAEERAAINFPIQGTAADIMKQAMIDVSHKLKSQDSGANIILQVHDELVLEVPHAEIEATKSLVVETMESAFDLHPALVANAEIGGNWRDME